jgi:hypothetical protein
MRLQGCIAVFTRIHYCSSHRNNYLQKSESSIIQIRSFTIECAERLLYHHIMEKRITTLEVTAIQTYKSMDHLERSVADLRSDMHHSVSDLRSEMHHSISGLRNELNSSISGLRTEMQSAMSLIHSDLGSLRRDVDRKFIWMMGTQIAALVAMMSAMAKLAHLF